MQQAKTEWVIVSTAEAGPLNYVHDYTDILCPIGASNTAHLRENG